MAWNGYRTGRIGGGGAQNGFNAPQATQAWTIGAIVNVGFLKGLEVVAKVGAEYHLRKGDALYSFAPHVGLGRLN